MRTFSFLTAFLLSTSLSVSNAFAAESPTLKLYTLDCGSVHVSDLDLFSDTYLYPGQEKTLPVSCFLIQHNKNYFLWDAGLNDSLAQHGEQGLANGPFTLKVMATLKAELEKLDLTPDQITKVGISHGHFDHVGNLNLFKGATLYIGAADYADLTKEAAEHPVGFDPSLLSHFIKKDQVQPVKGDYDVFGDGRVVMLSLPGHTPGHMALKVELPKAGTVILSGDQYHFRANRKNQGVPSFNTNRADTLASHHRIEQLIKNTKGTLIIQHDPEDIAALPALPNALQ